MTGEGRRPRRVAEDIRNCLATALGREFSDPRVTAAVITRVETTPDLGTAYVYVRSLMPVSESSAAALTRIFQRAAGKLRRAVGDQLRLKRVPELRFHYDESPDLRARVDELLAEVDREREPAGEDREGEPASEDREGEAASDE